MPELCGPLLLPAFVRAGTMAAGTQHAVSHDSATRTGDVGASMPFDAWTFPRASGVFLRNRERIKRCAWRDLAPTQPGSGR